ncbi:hypothetical protein OROGR_019745 [Orobanche gracilis]
MEIAQGIVTMLQWMGGSRRKVTTSRKSTHKRQKQYFEQRKQLQQRTTDLKSYDDGRRSCIGNNRSLDILSLVNVSTVAQGRKMSCINGDKSEEYDITLNHRYVLPCQAILDDEALHMDQTEILEETIAQRLNFQRSEISVIDLLSDSGANSDTEENSAHKQEDHVAFSIEVFREGGNRNSTSLTKDTCQ